MTMVLKNRAFRQTSALICLALFLALQVFSASSALHQAIHVDAGSAGHHCALTVLAQGHLDAPAVLAGSVAFVAALFFLLPPFRAAFLSSTDHRLSPSRAPPRF